LKRMLLLMLVMFLLTSCSKEKTESILTPPKEVVFSESTSLLSWGEVSGADAYVVSINNKLIETKDTFLDLSDYLTGNYVVMVKTVKGDASSYFSEYYKFSIIKDIELELIYDESFIRLQTEVTDLTFHVTVKHRNIEVKSYEIEERQLTYEPLDGLVLYHIKATFKGVVVYDHEFYINVDGYTKPKDETSLSLQTSFFGVLYFNGNEVDEASYEIIDNRLSVTSDYLNQFNDGIYPLEIRGETNYVTFIFLTVDPNPRITSSSDVMYTGSDLIFTFDLYGGSFIGLSSNPNIKKEEYVISEDQVLIKKEYIERLIVLDPTKKSVILTYVFDHKNGTQIGFITIRLT